jgi:hypothetical protein
VGNCCCYLQRDTTLEQLTTDHTLEQQLVGSGALWAHEGATSRLSTVLWNALGGGFDDLRPEVSKARFHEADILLLCTDDLPTRAGWRHPSAAAGSTREAAGRDAADLRVAGPALRRAH